MDQLTLPLGSALQNKVDCFNRATSLNFSESDANALCDAIDLSFTPNDQAMLQFEPLYITYMESDDYLDLPEEFIDSITGLVRFGLPESYLLAAVICHEVITNYYGHSDNRQGKYWFDKRADGQKLNIFNIPSPFSAQVISQKLKYPSGDAWTQVFCEHPELVLSAFEQLMQEELLSVSDANNKVLQQWEMAEALCQPNRVDIQSEIYKSASSKQVWFWHLYGLANGVDATENDFYAINAYTGEKYDDYGPTAVGGNEGVVLPEITDQEKSELELLVSSILHPS